MKKKWENRTIFYTALKSVVNSYWLFWNLHKGVIKLRLLLYCRQVRHKGNEVNRFQWSPILGSRLHTNHVLCFFFFFCGKRKQIKIKFSKCVWLMRCPASFWASECSLSCSLKERLRETRNRIFSQWRFLTTTTTTHFVLAVLFKVINPGEV